MKRFFILAITALGIFSSQISQAQFAVPGDNPASVKWYQTETDYYRIIYPAGLDSLARIYGTDLERYRIPVGRTAGFSPGELTRTKTPVVLFPFNANSNGLVSWAPKRMELYTTPSAESEPTTWHKHLTIHESRHVAQMQGGLNGLFKPMRYVVGEMFNGLVAGLYPRIEMLEGDAVVAETALTKSGRGRTADFMNYYMIAFDNGDFRTWEKWRFGSQRNYTLGQYEAGYLMVGGVRYLYGYTDVVGDFYRYIGRRPYDLGGFDTVVRHKTGKTMRQVYTEIADTLHATWQKDIDARKPFLQPEPVGKTPSRYTEYLSSEMIGDEIYSIKSGMTHSPELVRTDKNGKERKIREFAHGTSHLRLCQQTGRIYWSEPIEDIRWQQKVNNLIRYRYKGCVRNLTHEGKMYFPFPNGEWLSVTEYTDDGRSHIAIIDNRKGRTIASSAAPDSVQFVESVWDGNTIYASGISENGYGLYKIKCLGKIPVFTGEWENILAPQPVKICDIDIKNGRITFISDRTGVNEFYSFDLASNEMYRLTSTRYGGNNYIYNSTEDTLYFSPAGYEGKILHRVPASELLNEKVVFDDIYRYAMADELSRQEQELAAADTSSGPHNGGKVRFSEPRRYRKGAHLFNIHSWAPFYFDVDNIMAFSADHIYEMVSLGAAAISQNHLGTAVSRFGYSAHKDPYNKDFWRHSGHFKFTYSGWYPVIELSLDINDRGARDYATILTQTPEASYMGLSSKENGKPYINGMISAYIPFNFSSGGWSRGLVPKITYNIGNDIFHKGLAGLITDNDVKETFCFAENKGTALRHNITGSVRFHTMTYVPSSCVYPRWGFGIEAGASQDLGMRDYMAPSGYAYLYGYLPGVIRPHGLRLSALYQSPLDKDRIFRLNAVNTLPRGLAENSALSDGLGLLSHSLKLTADYAMPIYSGDLSIFRTFMYIKRFVLTPHFDFTLFDKGNLYSAGATFSIDFRSIFWLEFPISLGVTYSYNGGRSFNSIKQSGIPMGRHFVGPVFNISF